MPTLLIIGAKSDMAMATARRFARSGFNIRLTGRGDISVLERLAADLRIRFQIDAKASLLDLDDYDRHQALYDAIEPRPDVVLCAAGYLGEQQKAQENFDETLRVIRSNYSGCVSILNVVANDFEKRKNGCIIGISSVAGDRGRKSNYIYGSAKAGFTAYLSGLRNRLSASSVHVLTVKPGFVYTKMTEGLNLPSVLTARPEQVADAIFRAWKKKQNVLYIKSVWRYIMWVIRFIPERIFKRLNL